MKHKSHLCNFVYLTGFGTELQNTERSCLSIMSDTGRGKVHINTHVHGNTHKAYSNFSDIKAGKPTTAKM